MDVQTTPNNFLLASSNFSQKWPKNQSKRRGKIFTLLPKNMAPLPGVNQDIEHFKQYSQYFHQTYEILSTSRHKILVSKDSIMTKIISIFSRTTIFLNFFYSGHGQTNGDLCFETKQHPQGQKLTIEELVRLWRKYRPYKDAALFFYLDSCFAGQNLARYEKICQQDDFITIYASCGADQTCQDTELGGLLFLNQWVGYLNPFFLTLQDRKCLAKKFLAQKPSLYTLKAGITPFTFTQFFGGFQKKWKTQEDF